MTCRAVSVPEQQWYEIDDRGITNIDESHLLNVACPSFDVDTHPDSGVTRVRVYVYDGNFTFGVTARICRTFSHDARRSADRPSAAARASPAMPY